MDKERQYEYALDQHDRLIHIDQMDRKIRMENEYHCPNCGAQMSAVLGEKRVWYFRHYQGQTCSLETYWHMVCKSYFFWQYKDALDNQEPVKIMADVSTMCDHCSLGPCPIAKQTRLMDLTTKYTKVFLEKKENKGFRPDVLLKDVQGNELFVEIHVTSPCSPEKLASGVPIIEFHMTDASIDLLTARPIKAGEQVSFYNFIDNRQGPRKARGAECKKEIQDALVVYPSQKIFLFQGDNVGKPNNLPSGFIIQPVEHQDLLNSDELFMREIERAYHAGLKLKSCFLCEHGIPINNKFLNVYCDTRKELPHTTAIDCKDYSPNPDKFPMRFFNEREIEKRQTYNEMVDQGLVKPENK